MFQFDPILQTVHGRLSLRRMRPGVFTLFCVLSASVAWQVCLSPTFASEPLTRPNLVFILADDKNK